MSNAVWRQGRQDRFERLRPAVRELTRQGGDRMLFRSAHIYCRACRLPDAWQRAAAAPAAQVDACRLVDAAAVNAAARRSSGRPPRSRPIPRQARGEAAAGLPPNLPNIWTSRFLRARRAAARAYGPGPTADAGETPVPGVGDRAVYDQSNDPKDRYKVEEIAVLRGKAVLVFSVTQDKSVPFVAKEMLWAKAPARLPGSLCISGGHAKLAANLVFGDT